MINRIQEIKNIGTFLNSHPASITLSDIVLVYGSNSQGKTTLCDVVKSLKNQDPLFITQRKTVGQTDSPIVSFHFLNGKNAKFYRGAWHLDVGACDVSKIEIFDTSFVFDNVFTNNAIEHKNKENFTRFIIGEASVTLSKELLHLNEQKNELSRQFETISKDIESILEKRISLKDFLKIDFKEDISNEDVLLLGIKSTIQEETKNQKDISSIKSLIYPTKLDPICLEPFETIKEINEILKSFYSFQKHDLLELYNKHKKTYINSSDTVKIDNWILQGQQWIINNHCPFCGTSLTGNEKIDVFVEIFSKDIQKYNQKVLSISDIKFPTKINITPTKIIQNEDLIGKINAKVFDANILDLFGKLLSLREEILKQYEVCEQELKILVESIDKQIKNKLVNFYNTVDSVDLSSFYEVVDSYNLMIQQYNNFLEKFNITASDYIANLTVEKITQHLTELETQYNQLFAVVQRNLLNEKIVRYNELKKQIATITASAKRKKEDFDREQEAYLTEFYDDINTYFEKFGSRNYKIEKVITAKGTNKTYSLDVYFRGDLVPKDKIQFVLSESDRRALALAIFFTKLKRNATSDTIIFLDDPITSFDIDRMNTFINEVKKLKDIVAQVIITTHYQSFYKKVVELTYHEKPTLIKIIHGPITNDLQKVDPKNEPLLMDDYQSAIHSLITFMDGTTHSYSEVNARTLMQKCLEYHFAYEIRQANFNYTQLHELLNWLRDAGHIDASLFRELDLKREEYNSPAHQFDNDEEEQKRNSMIELYNLLKKI